MWHYLFIENPANTLATAESIHKGMFALLATSKNLDAAAFSRFDEQTGGVHYYFSPAAEIVAKAHNATPCEQPSKQDVGGLLYGDKTVVARFYG